MGAFWLQLTLAHLAEFEALPPLHKDPFDRLLIARAIAEQMPLATPDALIREYPRLPLVPWK